MTPQSCCGRLLSTAALAPPRPRRSTCYLTVSLVSTTNHVANPISSTSLIVIINGSLSIVPRYPVSPTLASLSSALQVEHWPSSLSFVSLVLVSGLQSCLMGLDARRHRKGHGILWCVLSRHFVSPIDLIFTTLDLAHPPQPFNPSPIPCWLLV